MSDRLAWETQAEHWVAWARTPGHDAFSAFVPAFLDEIVPPTAGHLLEIGCGEGRVMRKLAKRAQRLTGIDGSPSLVKHARALDTASTFTAADATALPFADGSFNTVVAFNSLQAMATVGDMASAVREAARVLVSGGIFCVCVPHPISDAMAVGGLAGDGKGSYFENAYVEDTVTKSGLTMTFTGWTYTLEDYARAFADAGLAIELLREPTPSSAGATPERLERWRRLPLFLFIRAVKAG